MAEREKEIDRERERERERRVTGTLERVEGEVSTRVVQIRKGNGFLW